MDVAEKVCVVCGESNYEQRDGYQYCLECGARDSDAPVREIEDHFDAEAGAFEKNLKQKIKQPEKFNAVRLTSWECYNYILVGMVDDLIGFGAKGELKRMTLRLWAAYLRRMEVAFCSKTEMALPKLTARYFRRDAEIIYRIKRLQKRRKIRDSVSMSSADKEKQASRALRKAKRMLDASSYSASEYSETDPSSCSQLSEESFSAVAIESLTKSVRLKDVLTEQETTRRARVAELDWFRNVMTTLCNKQIYAILGIALNLIGDSVQFSDLVRFIAEERTTSKHVKRYLPDNVQSDLHALLREIEFSTFQHAYSDDHLRKHAGYMARFLGLDDFHNVDIRLLVKRYALELNLPAEFATIACNLIDLYPPQFQTRAKHELPAYEARAMAYIIFVMKMLFGLDGEKERHLSYSAAAVNARLKLPVEDSRQTAQRKLFVWLEWKSFVKTRTKTIAQYNSNFARQYAQELSLDQRIDLMCADNVEPNEDIDITQNSNIKAKPLQRLKTFREILAQNLKFKPPAEMAFEPSLTPAHSYFEEYKRNTLDQHIPEFLTVDHKTCTIWHYVDAESLAQCATVSGYQLAPEQITGTPHCEFAGIFGCEREQPTRPQFFMADFRISHTDWLQQCEQSKLRNLTAHSGLEFTREFSQYGCKYMKKLLKKANPRAGRSKLYDENFVGDQTARRKEMNAAPATDCADGDLPKLKLLTPNFDYWTLLGNVSQLQEVDKRELRMHFSDNFDWLLELCAQTIGVDMFVVYDQLLAIEILFTVAIEDFEAFKVDRRFRELHPLKEINKLMNSYRKIW